MKDKSLSLSVGLGNTLKFVLLLDSITVGGALGSIDQLISKTLGDGLDVTESSLTSSSAEKPDSLEVKIVKILLEHNRI